MVNVIGLGYIGLPTALMLATHGIEVIGTDYNRTLVGTLNAGQTTFKEDGLNEIFSKALNEGITFTDTYQSGDFYIIAVPTPYDEQSKKIDPRHVIKAVESVLEVCEDDSIIVIESTIAPGTIDKNIRPLLKKRNDKNIHLAHAPERIIPGNMIFELENNNRTIGCDDISVGKQIKEVYASFCQGEIVLTDIRTAEMSKVVENTYRDINIAFANELAKICHSDDLDVYEIIRIANMHPRVNILSPGPGVGGHCISVDPWFLVGDYPGLTNLTLAARKVNSSMPDYVLKRASEITAANGITSSSEVGIYGLTYKEDVDDIRESPTLQLLDSMRNHLAQSQCKVYDPWIEQPVVPNQVFSMEDFLAELKLIIVMVGHTQLKKELPNLSKYFLLDTRNVCGSAPNVYKL